MAKGTVLITGGSGGIGKEIAKLFQQAGYGLVLVSLSQKELDACRPELGETHVTYWCMDLGLPNSGEQLFERCQQASITVDILINNAGFGLFGEHCDLDYTRLQSMLNLNMNTLANTCYLFGQQMKQRKSGTIINIGSTASFQPLPYMAGYAATKAFVVSFSAAFSEEMAKHGVNVICVCPGTTRTAFLQEAGIKDNQAIGSLDYVAYKVAMEPKKVADTVFNAFKKQQRFALPGLTNQAHYAFSRVLPKRLMQPIVSTIFRKPA